MNLLRQVVAEIHSMFAGDAVMSAFAVIIVTVAFALRSLTSVPSSLIGFGLFTGCVALLIARVYRFARRAKQS